MSSQTVRSVNRVWNRRNHDSRGKYAARQSDEHYNRQGQVGKTCYRTKNTRRVSFKQSGGETRDRHFNNKSERKLNLALRTLDDSENMVHGANGGYRGGNARSSIHRRRSPLSAENTSHKLRILTADESEWFQVIIPHGQKYGKDFILKALQDFVTPSDSFIPHKIKMESTALCMYVNNIRVAQALLNADRQFNLPDGFKMIIRVRNKLPPAESDAQLKEKMKRYNVATKALDLSKFHADVELKDIFCPLAVLRIMLAAIDIIEETVPDLEALDLSDNRIHLLHHLRCLATKLPNLKVLHLANNKIRSSNALDALRYSQLVDVVLQGNPLKDSLDEEGAYVSEMRKKFPKLQRLDFVNLPPQMGFDVSDNVTMPMPKENYLCNSNGADIVRQFIEQYFTIFDSDNRQSLLDAYHEDAMFSLTANHNSQKGLRLGSYLMHNRNIIRNKSVDSNCRYLKGGRLSVVSLLSELPATQHDIKSFAVDLLCFTPNLMQLTVTGIFREHDKHIRSFQRIFVVVPKAKEIIICSDSESAVKALSSCKLSAKSVLRGREDLETLSEGNAVSLVWVPGHSNIPGNEKADELARKGSEAGAVGPEPTMGLNASAIVGLLKREAEERHQRAWDELGNCRQAKEFLAGRDLRTTKYLLSLDRKRLRMIIGVLTGHNGLRYHLNKMGLSDNPNCRRCGDVPETAKHFLCHCPALSKLRTKRLGDFYLTLDEFAKIPKSNILSFITDSKWLDIPP